MSAQFPMPFAQTLTRIRARPELDTYSQEQAGEDWTNPDRAPIPGCAILGASTTKRADGLDSPTEKRQSLYAPPDADIREGDRIECPDGVFELGGIPAVERNPFTGFAPLLEVPIVRRIR